MSSDRWRDSGCLEGIKTGGNSTLGGQRMMVSSELGVHREAGEERTWTNRERRSRLERPLWIWMPAGRSGFSALNIDPEWNKRREGEYL